MVWGGVIVNSGLFQNAPGGKGIQTMHRHERAFGRSTLAAALPCEWRVDRPLQAEQPPEGWVLYCINARTQVDRQRQTQKTTQ